jgi:hypothetical protein
MRDVPFLKNAPLLIGAMAMSVCLSLPVKPAAPRQSSPSAVDRVEDAERRDGPFVIAGQNYSVVLHEKRLANTNEPILAQTLAGLEINDADGNVSYQKPFSYVVEQGHFQRNVSASTQLVSGKTGAGLVIYYREQTAASQTSAPEIREFWQVFGLRNGKLSPLGKPAPIGEGAGGGPFRGVMMRTANGTVSVISQPDLTEVHAWTGYFYVFVPLRVDWNHGGLAQGQRCMEMLGGGVKETGCDMRVEAARKPPAEEYGFIRLFPEAHDFSDEAGHVVVQKDSKVEVLGSRAITNWDESEDLIQPNFSDVWLHVSIDGQQGWIHGEEDFAAIGLPHGNPSP